MKRILLILTAFFMVIWSCSPDEEIVYGSGTELNISIVDEKGEKLPDGVNVYLYDNEDDFDKDITQL